MHAHAALVDRLYRSLAAHDHAGMAACYHEDATFKDIAFDRRGRDKIHDMWKFVTRPEPGLTVTFEIVDADDDQVTARLIDHYTFTETGQLVDNAITSTFHFRDGLIIDHQDVCDPVAWANMAMTGPKAWLAGHSRPVRALAANKKLREFLREENERRREGSNSES
jgi:ketosteroid isomerase-like protein